MYVGKTTKSFEQEAFGDHKLKKYHKALVRQKKGKPIFFFVCLPKKRGPKNESAIDEVESNLIQCAFKKNPQLLNDQKTKFAMWSIQGIIRSKGKVSQAAKDLKKCLDL
ncbi:MAG: hypothetical protein ACREQI_09390 [Candidatus Binataceae bacterium]